MRRAAAKTDIRPNTVLAVLFAGAFVMGCAEMLVVGMIDLIADDLAVSVPAAGVLVTFGRVPFLFYVAHLYLIHALAVGAGVLQGFPASAIRNAFPLLPEGYGFGLPVVYAVWLGAVALLYPLCRRWADLKARSRAWYLSYL